MKFRAVSIILFALAPLAILSCASAPSAALPPPKAQQPTPPAAPSPAPSPTQAQPAPPSPAPQTPPATAQSGTELVHKGQVTLTKAQYQQTFDDIRALIEELNVIIGNEDYTAWLSHLTAEYRDYYSNSATLQVISEQPILTRRGIVLRSLEDYFRYVVVPSRADAHLDDLDFVDPDHVKAITIVSGSRYILYDLKRQGNEWKIGLSS
ncbi:MAG TPA: hypothetical protein VMV68_10765 [Spirochaetia bacterium]|nr:hypothetical protein [Spirochaetia bacterium]